MLAVDMSNITELISAEEVTGFLRLYLGKLYVQHKSAAMMKVLYSVTPRSHLVEL